MVTRFRSSGPEGKPHSTKEGRSAEAQRAYMRKFGPRPPRRKRLSPTDKYKRDVLGQDMSDKYKEIKVSNTQTGLPKGRKVSNTQTGLPKGRKKFQHGGRTNLLEELGRVEGEHSNKNRRAEVSRIHGELNKGYAKGGRAGFSMAGKVVRDAKKAVSNWKEKQKAAKGITQKAVDALQKRTQTKNVKKLMTTGGAYKKRAPIKVVDKKTSAHPGGGYYGYKMYKSGGAVLKGKKVGIQIK